MYKLVLLMFAMLGMASAKPAVVAAPVAYTGLPVTSSIAYSAPAGFVTATSSQYIARNHNGIFAAPYVAAAPAARYVAAAPTAPLFASSAYSYAPYSPYATAFVF